MSTPVSSANSTSADQILLNFRQQIAGDQIPDSVMEEVVRRLTAEVDSTARAAAVSQGGTNGSVVSSTSTLAAGAQELTFTWIAPFPTTDYVPSLVPLSDPGAALRIWVKSKTTTRVVFGIVGATAATSFSFVAK